MPKAGVTYAEGAFDSTLAIARDGSYFRTKGAVRIIGWRKKDQWAPFEEVVIETEIYPFGQWHVRVHELTTTISLDLREGGFSVPLIGRLPQAQDRPGVESVKKAFVLKSLTSKAINKPVLFSQKPIPPSFSKN